MANTKKAQTPAKGKKNQKPPKEVVKEESSDEAPDASDMEDGSEEQEFEEASGESNAENGSDAENESDGEDVQMEDNDDATPKTETTEKIEPRIDDCEVGLGNTIYVGHLKQTTTRGDIAKLFEPYGKILSIIMRNVGFVTFFRNRNMAVNNAFVVFNNSDAVAKALELNGVEFEGKKLNVMNPETRECSNTENTVYIKNVNKETTEKSLEKLFSSCGEIIFASKKNFKKDAIVCFQNSDSVEAALKLTGTELDGSKLVVERLKNAGSEVVNHTVFVRIIKGTTTKSTLKEAFAPCGEITNINLKQTPKGAFAFVKFRDSNSVGAALKLDGTEVESQKIRVFNYNLDINNVEKKFLPRHHQKGNFKQKMQRIGSKYMGKKPHPGGSKTSKGDKPKKFQKSGGKSFRGVKPTGGIKKSPKKLAPKNKTK